MKLLLIRHATADDRSLGLADHTRQLTDKGRQQSRRLAAFLAGSGLHADVLLCSTLCRAQQTAQILHQHLSWPQPEAVDWLDIDSEAEAQQQAIARYTEQKGLELLVCVGHEPDISALLASYLGSEASCFQIKKASASLLDLTGRQACLLWSLPVALM
ncbi:phosphohistidine phosphatase SixA [Rheinheimera sp.]|uniref:phosphohistidine phosphatase SixA n=1 Tax=Rheinheimera sp. TaxID=1869214 RepID=UPI00307F940E